MKKKANFDGGSKPTIVEQVNRYVLASVARETRRRGAPPECEPEDIAQDVLTELVRKYGTQTTKWKGKLFRDKLRNLTRKAVRRPNNRISKRRQRGRGQEVPLTEAENHTHECTAKVDLALDVRAAIKELSARQRKVAEHLRQGRTVTEIAQELCVSRPTVEKDKRAIREALRDVVNQYR